MRRQFVTFVNFFPTQISPFKFRSFMWVCDRRAKNNKVFKDEDTAWKVSKYGVFSCPRLPVFGPEKTPYLDTFNTVSVFQNYI